MTDTNAVPLRPADQNQTPAPGWRAWLVLAVLTVPIFMVAIDMSVLFLALPSIAADLAPSATQQLWTLHIGDLLSAALVLTAGTLADRIGPRRLLAIGMAAYAGFSLIAAYAPNAEMLILARGLIAIGAVTVTPATMVLLRHLFPTDRQFATAVAVFMAAFSGGAAFGPPFGGLLLEHFSWGAIFLANIPVGILVVAALPLLPAIKGKPAGRIDLASIGLSLLAVALTVYGLQDMAAGGFSWVNAATIVLGLCLGTAFVRRQQVITQPLFDMGLFANPGFSVALAILLLFMMAVGASYMQLAQYLQSVLGHTPLEAGLLLTIPASVQVGATALAPKLLRVMSPAQAIASGAMLAIIGSGLVLLGTMLSGTHATITIITGDTVAAMGGGPIFALGAGIIIASAPFGKTGSASGAQEVAGSLGNGLGVAIGGSLAVIVYQAAMGAMAADGLDPAKARQSAESIGRAMALAAALPDETGVALQLAAQAAFKDATRTVYVYALLLYVGFIALTVVGLRNVRLKDEAAEGALTEPT